jgi:hypothetical protein
MAVTIAAWCMRPSLWMTGKASSVCDAMSAPSRIAEANE